MFGLLTEMNRKIEMMTDENMSVHSRHTSQMPAPGPSPQFQAQGKNLNNKLQQDLRLEKHISFGGEQNASSANGTQIQGSFLTSEESRIQIQVANNATNSQIEVDD